MARAEAERQLARTVVYKRRRSDFLHVVNVKTRIHRICTSDAPIIMPSSRQFLENYYVREMMLDIRPMPPCMVSPTVRCLPNSQSGGSSAL